jgi:hypothetical protein
MRWRKADEELERLLDETVEGLKTHKSIDRRPMLECPCPIHPRQHVLAGV